MNTFQNAMNTYVEMIFHCFHEIVWFKMSAIQNPLSILWYADMYLDKVFRFMFIDVENVEFYWLLISIAFHCRLPIANPSILSNCEISC